MLLIRYELVSPTGRSYGLLSGGHDCSQGALNLGISNEEYWALRASCLDWLPFPNQEGMYWYTIEGDRASFLLRC